MKCVEIFNLNIRGFDVAYLQRIARGSSRPWRERGVFSDVPTTDAARMCDGLRARNGCWRCVSCSVLRRSSSLPRPNADVRKTCPPSSLHGRTSWLLPFRPGT